MKMALAILDWYGQGSEQAGELAAGLDVFKNATNVRADPDKPLQHIRIQTLKVCQCFISYHIIS